MQDDITLYLANEWDGLMAAANTNDRDSTAVFNKIIIAYREPQRFYHTAEHIAALMEQAGPLHFADPISVRMAILYHDIVYDTDPNILAKIKAGSHASNEERSALIAIKDMTLLGFSPETIERTARMIRLTARHQLEPDNSHDAALFLDMDMSILGASPANYDLYTSQIHNEYSQLDPTIRTPARLAFLNATLQSDIFHTDLYVAKYDAQARQNLVREQAMLQSGIRLTP